MLKLETRAQLEALHSGLMKESLTLEYKSSGAVDKTQPKKEEIAKDALAFANAAGGQIVYGMKETDNLPEGLDGGIDPLGQTGSWRPCGTAIPRAWRVSFPEPSSSLQDDREGPLTLCPSGAPLPLRLWRPTLRLSIVNAPFRRAFYGFSFEVCERHERGETMPPPRSSSACATPCAVLPKVEHWGSDDPVFAWVSKDSAIRHMTYMAISAGYQLGLRPGGRFWN